MTTPSQARTSNDGKRMYPWPPTPPYEFESISVTSAIANGLPKPFLLPWVAKVVAEAAIEDHDIVGALIAKDNVRAAVEHLKGARFRDMGAKADRGTIVHAALEAYLEGRSMTDAEIQEELRHALVPQKMWASASGMVSGVMQFLADETPEVLWSERTVFSRSHGYAGTADLVARMRVGESVVPVIIDVKTSKRVYDETALQLCAYARADFVGLDDGTEAPLVDPAAPIEYGVVVRPMPSGRYEKVVFALTDEVFALYLACLFVATNAGVLKTTRRP